MGADIYFSFFGHISYILPPWLYWLFGVTFALHGGTDGYYVIEKGHQRPSSSVVPRGKKKETIVTTKGRFTEGWGPEKLHIARGKSELTDLRGDVEEAMEKVADEQSSLVTARSSDLGEVTSDLMGAVIAGDAVLVLLNDEDLEMLASELNAAAAGEYVKYPVVALQTADGRIHTWAKFAPTAVTPTESVADADVGVPVVTWQEPRTGSAEFLDGNLPMDVALDVDEGATKVYQAGTKSTGDITCVEVSKLIDGQTVSWDDALGTTKTFEFDVAGDGVTPGNVQVDVSTLTTDVEVADALRAAINGLTDFRCTASGATAVVDLEQDDALAAGDVVITETVVDAGFLKTDFTGGVDRDSVKVTIDVSGISLLSAVTDLDVEYYVV